MLPGPGLPMKKSRKLHVVADLRGESEHDRGARASAVMARRRSRERRVVAADHDELRVGEAPGDALHGARAVTAEHHEAGGPVRIQAQFAQLRAAVDVRRRA